MHSYSISITTLEEVFLRVGLNEHEDVDAKSKIESRHHVKSLLQKRTNERNEMKIPNHNNHNTNHTNNNTNHTNHTNHNSLSTNSILDTKLLSDLNNNNNNNNNNNKNKRDVSFWRHYKALLIKRYYNNKSLIFNQII